MVFVRHVELKEIFAARIKYVMMIWFAERVDFVKNAEGLIILVAVEKVVKGVI